MEISFLVQVDRITFCCVNLAEYVLKFCCCWELPGDCCCTGCHPSIDSSGCSDSVFSDAEICSHNYFLSGVNSCMWEMISLSIMLSGNYLLLIVGVARSNILCASWLDIPNTPTTNQCLVLYRFTISYSRNISNAKILETSSGVMFVV